MPIIFLFQSLRRYQDTDYVHGIVSIKEHNGNFNVQCFHTMNIENIVAPFTDVKQLNDDQKFVTATIADMKRLLNKFWDCQCTATVIVSPERDFRSSQTFMMVNGYIMRTEPRKPNRETAATPAKGS